MFLNKNDKIHFIGIGGMSMSALACILQNDGYYVQGSDLHKSEITNDLQNKGINVYIGHNKNNVKNANVVVYNYAIHEDNEELKFAQNNNLKIISRGQLLGFICKNYKNVIAISGAHGKTTTTGMISSIFLTANKNPTIHLGGILNSIGSNYYIGDTTYFITEACEYHDCFLNFKSKVGVILNIEAEHLDYFKNFRNVLKSFTKFAKNSETVVISSNYSFNNAITVGNNADYYYKALKYCKKFMSFKVYKNNKFYAKIKLKCYGEHNAINALFAIAVSDKFNLSQKDIVKGLFNFTGTKRRFEVLRNKPYMVHDYAHHPAEIKSAISTIKQISKNKLIVIFQPHTYSRTHNLKTEFINSLKNLEEIYIIKTYPARETYIKSGSAKTLYQQLKKLNANVLYFENFKKCEQHLRKINLHKTDVLFLGAGDIHKLAYRFKG